MVFSPADALRTGTGATQRWPSADGVRWARAHYLRCSGSNRHRPGSIVVVAVVVVVVPSSARAVVPSATLATSGPTTTLLPGFS